MITATSIELLKNLAQYDYSNRYYDFHNDYNCERINYDEGTFSLLFKSLKDDSYVSLKFTDVRITVLELFDVQGTGYSTLDNLYRGRFQLDEKLFEVSEDGSGYFYLEFYEGQKFEFWAKCVVVEQVADHDP